MTRLRLLCKKQELQLQGTLNGGQSFRWKKILKDGIEQWIGVFASRVWVLEQGDDCIYYEVHESSDLVEAEANKDLYDKMLKDYFQLDLSLNQYYTAWSAKDPYFEEAAKQFYGVRILRQDPVENIFSFICSQNNHISRISSMVEKLATFYGPKICDFNGTTYHAFPKVEDLHTSKTEHTLRQNGFGYRAKYISKSAEQIVEQGGANWLEKLKNMEYEDAKTNLIGLCGIGPKVADCICLMSLGHLQAIPVDTHVYQIAMRYYMPKLAKQKSVTDKVYNEIGEYFRDLYGPLAGWAQTVLFCADLKKFKVSENDGESNKRISKKKKC